MKLLKSGMIQFCIAAFVIFLVYQILPYFRPDIILLLTGIFLIIYHNFKLKK